MKKLTLEEYEERRRRQYENQKRYYYRKKQEKLDKAKKLAETKAKELKGDN